MNESLKLETEKLIRSWMQHEPQHLGQYLISGVEDPRINVQSILTRHFLLREVFGDRFDRMMLEECRFAAALNWLLTLGPELADPDLRAALHHALQRGSDNAEGLIVPGFLGDTFRLLPVPIDSLGPINIPNYLQAFLNRPSQQAGTPLDRHILDTFITVWKSVLQPFSKALPARLSVFEPACGSANEYRFLKASGLTPFIDYRGFDLCEKNVVNSRKDFPDAGFAEGNVFGIEAADKSYDLCFFHDLLEHLSVQGLHRAISEIGRVTRRGISAGFFQMHEGAEHIVRQVDEYHWNTLSMQQVRVLFQEHGFEVQVVHIATFLRQKFGCEYTHNRDAYTLVMRR